MKLLRHAHWIAVLLLCTQVPDYWLFPAMLCIPGVELGSILICGRTMGDMIGGTVAVYEDTFDKELRDNQLAQEMRRQRERARRIKMKRLLNRRSGAQQV